MRYDRREKSGGEPSQFTPSAPNTGEPKTIPFAQRLTCTIGEACEATGLGRTKLYELIGSGQLVTTTVGRRRLVVVHSLISLIEPNGSTR
jgi:excisionase family DNA binding protein